MDGYESKLNSLIHSAAAKGMMVDQDEHESPFYWNTKENIVNAESNASVWATHIDEMDENMKDEVGHFY